MSERAATSTLDFVVEDDGNLHDLLNGPIAVRTPRSRIDGALVGRLIGFKDDGTVPLVTYEGQPISGALPARATLDLHGSHIGRDIVLMFGDGDPQRPIIMGCLHDAHARTLSAQRDAVDVDVDGQRLVVTAKEQLVLRCGKASITLTKAGKVLIDGAYVSNRSSGVVRIKGGSVQIN